MNPVNLPENNQTFYFKNRFFFVLCSLILLLVASPVVEYLSESAAADHRIGWSRLLLFMVYLALLLSMVLAISRRRRTILFAGVFAGLVSVTQVAGYINPSMGVMLAEQAIAAGFILFVIFVLLRFLFDSRRVTANIICASLCIYLLLGLLWGYFYGIALILNPEGAFDYAYESGASTVPTSGTENAIFALYYSLVTLTTLGYGDIVPGASSTRMLAACEAIVGQIYMTVLVARLVGLHIAHSIPEEKSEA